MQFSMEKCRDWLFVNIPAVMGIMVVIIFIVPVLVLMWIWDDECNLAIRNAMPSPDGRLSAIIFEMECDATVALNTQVSIVPADKPFSPKKNPSFLALRGQHDLAVRWIGENVIEVGIPEDTTIYRNDASVGDITVEYR